MPIDVHLTTDRDIEIDETGDFRIVTGDDNIGQQQVNALFRAAENIDIQLTNPNIKSEFANAIRDELNELDYIEEIQRLDVETVDRKTLKATVETNATREPISREVNT